MAFNPFHTFRKHQKVIFAVLTILCMFIFVFTWGVGDISQRGKGWFGGGKGGVFVAKVYGTKVYASDLSKWSQQRRMSNFFILFLRNMALEAIASDPRGKSEPRLQTALEFLAIPSEFISQLSQEKQREYMFSPQTVQFLLNDLKDKPGKEDERKYLEEVAAALRIKQEFMFLRSMDYFGSSTSYEALLDFDLWKHQADKLGIVLTPVAVRQLLARDTAGRSVLPEGSFLANKQFRGSMGAFLTQFGINSESQILDALADEYRVIMAQEALLGQALNYQGPGGIFSSNNEWSPVTFTAGEYQQYFREQRTTVKAALLPLPIDAFEHDIKATPTPDQLRSLYDNYKTKEPSPTQPYPGFKQPREMRVQYVRINPKDEFYQNLAKKLYVPTTALSQANEAIKQEFQAGCGAALLGGGPGSWLTVGLPLATDPVLREYGAYFGHFQSGSDDEKRSVASGRKVAPDIYDPHYDAASAMGYLLGVVGQGNPVAASAAITSTKRVHTQDQARGVGAMILAGTSPTPGLGGDLQPLTNYVQPLSKMDAFIVEQTRDHMAQALAITNLGKMITEVQELHAKPEEAEKAVERLTKEYHFKLETMATAKDQWSIAADPALKDLRAAFVKGAPSLTDQLFADQFVKLPGVYELSTTVEERNNPAGRSRREWNAVMGSDHEIFEYWLIENKPAKVRSFEAAKPDVIKAWQREEERKLALKKAAEIEGKIRQQTWATDDATRQREVEAFLNRYNDYGKAFVLNNVARQVEKDSPNAKTEKEYEPYQVKEADIKDPPDNFVDRVVSLQKPGDTAYVQNLPKTTVYVVVLLTRTEPTDKDFEQSYKRAADRGAADSLWTGFVASRRGDFTKNFIEKMREEAAPEQAANGKWTLPEELTSRQRKSDEE